MFRILEIGPALRGQPIHGEWAKQGGQYPSGGAHRAQRHHLQRQDYRVSFVYDEKIIGDHVIARIIEKVRQPKPVKDAHGQADQGKPVFEDNTKVIWDNQDHEMTDAVEFTATSTKRIAIEVTAPGIPEDPKSKNSGKKMTDIGCLGILIEHMPTPAIGF